ncbi:sterol desaturase family protein [Alteromonas ponticola]|uniref:Sterol desaturase family protein n=1 Tax=Alteromonas aquimaris TaxID=2998417 RepID=A0ABT3P350_9ALTE|nr:sterol desaturase family protein [Alteromonas aquimaris]MCW8107162.1 sterol desaturase family protein [Alteromonas aquimaris]
MYDFLIDSFYLIGDTATKLFGIALIFLALAFIVKGKKAISALRTALPNTVFNINIMALNLLLLTPVLVWISQLQKQHNLLLIQPDTWQSIPEPLVIFVAVFLGDFIGYWRHRFEHTSFLWPSHMMHHSDANMTWLTLERFHPINRLSTFIIDSTFLLAVGLPPYAILINGLVRHYYGFFIHADLPWAYGKLGYVFVSPVMHRWHHAEEQAAHKTNFATVFAVFDLAFGTYRVPGLCTKPLGVKGQSSASLVAQLIYPFRFSSYKTGAARQQYESKIHAQPTEKTLR